MAAESSQCRDPQTALLAAGSRSEYRVPLVMASVVKSARSAAKSCLGLSLNIAAGALLTCGVIAGSAWGLASAVSAMHEAGRAISEGPVELKLAVSDIRPPAAVPMAVKSSRFLRLPES